RREHVDQRQVAFVELGDLDLVPYAGRLAEEAGDAIDAVAFVACEGRAPIAADRLDGDAGEMRQQIGLVHALAQGLGDVQQRGGDLGFLLLFTRRARELRRANEAVEAV